MTEDRRNLPKLLREAERRVNAHVFKTGGDDALASIPANLDRDVDLLLMEAAAEIERLSETLTFPRITPEAPAEQLMAILHDHDKGRPVNAQDLINALAWRVRNQRREIAKLHERLRKKQSDEAASFSPNFDERNGIR